jgi:hypothetical protein
MLPLIIISNENNVDIFIFQNMWYKNVKVAKLNCKYFVANQILIKNDKLSVYYSKVK